MTSYIDSFADPRSFSRDKVCKAFNGNGIVRGYSATRSPWTFWDGFQLRVDTRNVIWLTMPQTARNGHAWEAAIALLTAKGKYSILPTIYLEGLSKKDRSITIDQLWGKIRERMPISQDHNLIRDNRALEIQLTKHLQKYVASVYCPFTDQSKRRKSTYNNDSDFDALVREDPYAGMNNWQRKRAQKSAKYFAAKGRKGVEIR